LVRQSISTLNAVIYMQLKSEMQVPEVVAKPKKNHIRDLRRTITLHHIGASLFTQCRYQIRETQKKHLLCSPVYLTWDTLTAAQAAINFTKTISPDSFTQMQRHIMDQSAPFAPAPATMFRQLGAAVLNFTYATGNFTAILPSASSPGQKTLTTGSLRLG
jgi:hypothetical protein